MVTIVVWERHRMCSMSRVWHMLRALVYCCLLSRCVCLDDPESQAKKRPTVLRHRHLQQMDQRFAVLLFLQLYYVNSGVASQIEQTKMQPVQSNVVAAHFCQAVNEQASGDQVQQSANSIGAVISTRIGQNESYVDYGCTIIDTNRAYDNDGEDLFGVGYFILEVAVQQMVYVKSDKDVDPATVASIVEAGFSRSQGGRVEFRSLLTNLPVFGTVVDVGVLDDALSDPQLPPTTKPSIPPPSTESPVPTLLPTGKETLPPSPVPSPSPSKQPTNSPIKQPVSSSSNPTAALDILSPSEPPAPSNLPSKPPSKQSMPPKPSMHPKAPVPLKPTKPISPTKPVFYSEEDESLEDSESDRQPLIIAAIASGIATILVSCFFIFCIWYPFCWQKRDGREALEEAPRHRRRRSSASSHSSESTRAAEAMIPGVLHLDEDSRSLANTTVTQTTAKPAPSIYSKPNAKGWKMQTASFEPVSILDSFDENSVYTSTLGSNASTLDQAQDGNNTSAMQTTVAVHDMIVDATEDGGASISDSATDPFDLDSQIEHTVAKYLCEPESDSFQLPYRGNEEEKVAEKSDSDSDSDPFEMEENVVKADEASLANIGVDSEGFDPYAADGDSSIGMTSLAISDSSFGPPMNESIGKISVSSVSAKTKQTDNLDAGARTSNMNNDNVGWSEQQPSLNSDSDDEGYATSVVADSSATLPSSSVASTANNILLRNILDDARLLARKGNSSSRSAASGKSAPSRLNWKHLHQEATPKRATTDRLAPRLHDLITDNSELKDHEDPSRATSHSVNGIGRSPTDGSPEQLTKFSHRTKYLDTNSILSDNEKLSDRLEFQGRPSGDTTNDSSILAPSASNLIPSRERTTLGARPMEQPWGLGHDDGADDEELLVTPPSTPGMVGTTEQANPGHWLFEAEVPLGARPRSLSPSRSLAWSAASTKSFDNDVTRYHGIYRQHQSVPHGTPGGGSSRVGVHLGEQKTASDEMSKSSLENDLRRLERRLVKRIQSADDYLGPTDGVGGSLITVDQGQTRRIIVVAPPGKLGVTLADHHDGKGIVVAEVGPHSSMKGKLAPGDKLIAIDDDDVSNMVVNQITSMMASRASKERRLTLLTKTVVELRAELQETKQDGTP